MKIKKTKKIIIAAIVVLGVLGALPIAAVNPVWNEAQNQMRDLAPIFGGAVDVRIIIANILKYFLTFVGIIFLVYIVYAGFSWMTAGGNDDKIKRAKETLTAGVIGITVIIMAFAIARFVIIAARCATDTSGSWCALVYNIAW